MISLYLMLKKTHQNVENSYMNIDVIIYTNIH